MASENPALDTRNKWTFSVGTIGRDMVYTLMSMFLLVFLTESMQVSRWVLAVVTVILLVTRLVDAVLDIVMGSIVDNTRTRWGQYKPWILGGMIASAVFTVLLFTNLGLSDVGFIVVFSLLYLCWSLSWTANDVPYWSLLPTLSLKQKRREEIGALAKIFATIGTFSVVIANPEPWAPKAIAENQRAWFMFAVVVVIIMVCGQCVTLFGTKEPKLVVEQDKVTPRQFIRAVYQNDQLMWTAVAMVLFMTGYLTTTTFGVYFFKYAYGNEAMFPPFGAVLGVASVVGYLIFPTLRKRFKRLQLYSAAIGLILVGYVVFFFAPMNIIVIGVAALMLFLGQSFITILMLGFITDTIDYGHWKFGRRNTAVTFALQPFINKVGAALANAVVAVTLMLAGIDEATSAAQVTTGGLWTMKVGMLVVPPVLILTGYLIYRSKYRIDEVFHAQILSDLAQRGQLTDEGAEQREELADEGTGQLPTS